MVEEKEEEKGRKMGKGTGGIKTFNSDEECRSRCRKWKDNGRRREREGEKEMLTSFIRIFYDH